MAEVVASWAVGSFTDPQNGQAPIDADDVRANDNTLRTGFNNHDADAAIHFQSSVIGARPAAGTAGRKWFSSDTKQIHRDTGSVWEEIDYLNLTNGGTVAGATTFTGTVTSTAGSRTFGATTFTGTVSGTAATFSSTVTAAGATLTGALSGTSASFSSTIAAAGATLTGALGGTSATFSGTLTVAGTIVAGSTLTMADAIGGNTGANKDLFLQPGGASGRVVIRSSASAELVSFSNAGVVTLPAVGTIVAATTLTLVAAAINGIQVDTDNTANFTRLLVGVGASVGLQRVKLGAAGSGAVGGTSRALYLDYGA